MANEKDRSLHNLKNSSNIGLGHGKGAKQVKADGSLAKDPKDDWKTHAIKTTNRGKPKPPKPPTTPTPQAKQVDKGKGDWQQKIMAERNTKVSPKVSKAPSKPIQKSKQVTKSK